MKNQLKPGLVAGIDAFCRKADDVAASCGAYSQTPSPTRKPVYISDKWCRIVSVEWLGDGTSKESCVYAFVALKDYETKVLGKVKAGDIHLPAGWKAPARHARGSIFDEKTWKCAGPFGISYLR